MPKVGEFGDTKDTLLPVDDHPIFGEEAEDLTEVRFMLLFGVGTGLGTGIELLYLAIFITLHTIYIIVITCVSCDLEILFYEV